MSGRGPWCHPIASPHHCGDLSLPYQGAPVGNGGLPAAANRFLSPRRLARAIRFALAVPVLTVSGSLPGPRDLLVLARTTLAASYRNGRILAISASRLGSAWPIRTVGK